MKRHVAVLAVLVPAAAIGCNEVEAYPFDSSGVARPSTAGFPGSRSGSGVLALPLVVCPREAPTEGSACENSALRCEYGSHVDARCNPFLECDGERWRTVAGEPCAEACPANRADIVDGEPCVVPTELRAPHATGVDDETLCAAASELCVCRRGERDASRWACAPRDVGCPAFRPRIGSSCSSPRVCDYGACVFESGLSLECVTPPGAAASSSSLPAGVWLVREPSCSTSGLENNP